ncbi:MAG: BREX-4 system phosphatase PglZ [Kosmotogaceae bacterium]
MRIVESSNLQEIFAEIKKDKNTNSFVENRFPVRFIFLPDFDSMQKLYQHLVGEHNCRIENVSSLLPHEDGWVMPTAIVHNIKKIIKNGQDKDIVVIPLSEIIRFFTDKNFISTLFSLCEIENMPETRKRRIYIPFVGLHERFEKDFEDYFNREWAPIWRLKGSVTKKLKIIMCTHPELCGVIHPREGQSLNIQNTKDWLELWKRPKENLFRSDIVCHSDTISRLYDNSEPDSFFKFEEICTYKDVVSLLHGLSIPIEYQSTEKEIWIKIYKLISSEFEEPPKNFEDLITSTFNIKKVEDENPLYLLLSRKKTVYRWLLINYLLNNSTYNRPYLYEVLKSLHTYDNKSIEVELWTRIFKFEKKELNIIKDRIESLRQFYESTQKTPDDIESIIKQELDQGFKQCDSIRDKFKLLTGISNIEKKRILELSKIALENEELSRRELLNIYSEIYPSLFKYLSPISFDNDSKKLLWITNYFIEYRWSKVLDSITKGLSEILNSKNKEEKTFYEWYNQIPSSVSLLDIEKNTHTDVLWIDALGFEWANLLYHSLSKKRSVEKISASRSELPTTTRHNRYDSVEPQNHILALDKLIHGERAYEYPDSLIREIEKVEEMINTKIDSVGRKIIVSDHGFTAFSRKKHGISKKYNFTDAEHEGRCMWTPQQYTSDPDYLSITYSDNKKKGGNILVALRHDSLNVAARREAHGGATPEEVIVPFLVLETEKSKDEYYIHPKKFEIQEGKDQILELNIEPKPRSAVLTDEDKYNWSLKYDTNTRKWRESLTELPIGTHHLSLIVNGTKTATIEIEITGGMSVRDII